MKLSEIAAPQQSKLKLSDIQAAQQEQTDAGSQDSIVDDALDVVGELSAAANRSVAEMVDFLGPNAINSILQLSGSDKRVPKLADQPFFNQSGFMEPGAARDVVQGAGGALPAAAAFYQVPGRNLAKAGDAALELAGVGSAKITEPVRYAFPAAIDAVQNAMPSKAKDAAKLPLLRRSGDVAAAGYKLDDAGRVVNDTIQKKALKAGIDEGAVSMIAAANKATKKRISNMLDIVEKGKSNLEFRSVNRPSAVVGDALADRFNVIYRANKAAGSRLDSVADGLKNKPVDIKPAIDNFMNDLAREGIKFDPSLGRLDFSESTIQGLGGMEGPQKIISNVLRRLYNTKDPTKDAYQVHMAKKFLDRQVSYGKTKAGLDGAMETIVKRLRHNLDSALDSSFDEYNRVNTIYAETRGLLDDVQDMAGPRADLLAQNANKSLGLMSRKLLSNYASGVPMENVLNNLDDMARKYSNPSEFVADDEITKLIATESELRRLFSTVPPANSFQGEIGAEIGRGAADLATGNKIGLVGRTLKNVGRIFTKDDNAKLEALRELVKQ